MTEIELAWLAGLLEGEGSFGFGVIKRPDRQSDTSYIRVRLSMTDHDVIQRAANLTGAPVCGPYRGKSGKDKPIWCADVPGYKAEIIMRQILPFMGERRTAQITKALEHWDARPRKHRQTGLPPTCHPDREHYSVGLCQRCYELARWARRKARTAD